jgi:hypothetical protein
LTGRRYLLGVIPGRCTPDDLTFLRDETDCVIGLHGIDHDEAHLDVYGHEFPAYLSKLEILRRLVTARDGLEVAIGRPVRTYMPPRNRIDMRTAAVVGGHFDRYTGGPETDRDVMLRFQNYIYSDFPHGYGRTDEMLVRGSHEHLMRWSDSGQEPVLALHWTWETNIGLDHMRAMLSQIPRTYFGDFDV